jgi:hypothetical protein
MYERVRYEAERPVGWNRRLIGLAIVIALAILVMWAMAVALIAVAPALISWLVLLVE